MERFKEAHPPRNRRGVDATHVASEHQRPACSIVIPTYNGRDLLARCLASIERHRPDPARIPTEIIVVDNGSSDGTSEWLAHAYPAVRVVRLEPNRGILGVANGGPAATREEIP